MPEVGKKTGLQERLEREPDYRPYCLNCDTMERMSIIEREGRRILTCKIEAETHESARIMKERFGIPPRVGCGIEYDIDADKILFGGLQKARYPR